MLKALGLTFVKLTVVWLQLLLIVALTLLTVYQDAVVTKQRELIRALYSDTWGKGQTWQQKAQEELKKLHVRPPIPKAVEQ